MRNALPCLISAGNCDTRFHNNLRRFNSVVACSTAKSSTFVAINGKSAFEFRSLVFFNLVAS